MAYADEMLAELDRLELQHTESMASLLLDLSGKIVEAMRKNEPLQYNFTILMALELARIWGSAISAAAELTGKELSVLEAGKAGETIFAAIDNFASQYRAGLAQQLVDTTQRQIRNLVAGGLSSGQAADAVYADILEKLPGLSNLRALLITRTELHAAAQYAAWKTALSSSLPLVKVWYSVNDTQTRDFGEVGAVSQFNHRRMHGVREQLSVPFTIPRIDGAYENLMFPGDPHGSAGNVINCRCIMSFERGYR